MVGLFIVPEELFTISYDATSVGTLSLNQYVT